MADPEPLARTGAAGRRLWKPDRGPGIPLARETYPFEVPVLRSGRPRLHLLCRARYEVIDVRKGVLGLAYRIRLLILWLDRATMDVRATVCEVFSREAVAERQEAVRLGNQLTQSEYQRLTRHGLTYAAFERLMKATREEQHHVDEGQQEEVSTEEAEAATEGGHDGEAVRIPETHS